MPLFDPNNPTSAEAAALWHLATLISECTAAQQLAGETAGTAEENAEATREKIIVGPHEGPLVDDRFSKDELADQVVWFQLWSPIDGGKAVVKSESSFDRGDEAGQFSLTTRFYCQDSAMDDEQDLYLYFLDRIAALEQEMMTKAETRECPRLQAVTRQLGPAFASRDKANSQGEHIHAMHSITWGDPIAD